MLDDERVTQKAEKRTGIGGDEKSDRGQVSSRMRDPAGQQWRCHRQDDKWQADARKQKAKDAERRIFGAFRLPGVGGNYRQQKDTQAESDNDRPRLNGKACASEHVGRRVASEEGQLKEQGTDKPGGRAAPEPRQDELGQDGLNLKAQEARQRHGGGECGHHGNARGYQARAIRFLVSHTQARGTSARSATDLCLGDRPLGALTSDVDVDAFSKSEPQDASAASAT